MSWWDDVRDFLRGAPEESEPERLTEASIGTPYDPDAGLNAAQLGSLYVRRLTDTGGKDLDAITQNRAQDICFYLYDRNPMGKRITELIRDFVVGEGISAHATSEVEETKNAVQEVLDRHWNDGLNRLDLKLPQKVLELGLYGEQCYSAFVNPVNGFVRWGYIDPCRIAAVHTNPENVEEYISVELRAPIGQNPKRYRVIHEDERPQSPSYGRLVGAQRTTALELAPGAEPSAQATTETGLPRITETYVVDGETRTYDGSCMIFQVNKVTNATRGRPDLLANADWVDALDQLLFGEVDRAFLLKNFVWDVEYQGASVTEIQRYLEEQGAPAPGAVRGHNEKVKWNAVAPSLAAADSQTFVDIIVSYIATGCGLPKTWLNGTEDVNKATASELGEPAFKHLTERQRYVRFIVEQMLRYVLDEAEMANQLPKRKASSGGKPVAWDFTVTAPEIRTKDLAMASTTLKAVVEAVIAMLAEKLIDEELAQEIVAMMIGQLGIDVDLKAMRERLDAEAEEAAQAQKEQFGPDGVTHPLGDQQTMDGDPMDALQKLLSGRSNGDGPAPVLHGAAAVTAARARQGGN